MVRDVSLDIMRDNELSPKPVKRKLAQFNMGVFTMPPMRRVIMPITTSRNERQGTQSIKR